MNLNIFLRNLNLFLKTISFKIINFLPKKTRQLYIVLCCACLPPGKYAHYKGQALLLLHLIGQGGSCMDKI